MIRIEDTKLCMHNLYRQFKIALPKQDILQYELLDNAKVKQWVPSLIRYLEGSDDKIFAESVLIGLGDLHMCYENYEEAALLYQINTIQYPDSAISWLSLAQVQIKLKNYSAALRYYNEVLDLEPENREIKHTMNQISLAITG